MIMNHATMLIVLHSVTQSVVAIRHIMKHLNHFTLSVMELDIKLKGAEKPPTALEYNQELRVYNFTVAASVCCLAVKCC